MLFSIYSLTGAVIGAGISVLLMTLLKLEKTTSPKIAVLLIGLLGGFICGWKYYDALPKLGLDDLNASIPYLSNVEKRAPDIYDRVVSPYHEKIESQTLSKADIQSINDHFRTLVKENQTLGFPINITRKAFDLELQALKYFASHKPQICQNMYNNNDASALSFENSLPQDLKDAKQEYITQRIIGGMPSHTQKPDYTIGARLQYDITEKHISPLRNGDELCSKRIQKFENITKLDDENFIALMDFLDLPSKKRTKIRFLSEQDVLDDLPPLRHVKELNSEAYRWTFWGHEKHLKTNTLTLDDLHDIRESYNLYFDSGIWNPPASTLRKYHDFQIERFSNLKNAYPQACTLDINYQSFDRHHANKLLGADYIDKTNKITALIYIGRRNEDEETLPDEVNGEKIYNIILNRTMRSFGIEHLNPAIDTPENLNAHRQICDLHIAMFQTRLKLSNQDLRDVWRYQRKHIRTLDDE